MRDGTGQDGWRLRVVENGWRLRVKDCGVLDWVGIMRVGFFCVMSASASRSSGVGGC